MMKLTTILIVLGAVIMLACTAKHSKPIDYVGSNQHNGEKFVNDKSIETGGFATFTKIVKRYLFEPRVAAEPEHNIPVAQLTAKQLVERNSQGTAVYRLGHSSLLLAVNGEFWLIDPVFSERASPFTSFGPKRFHQVPISLDELPEIKGVIISHDHYDHLDKASIKRLNARVQHFIVPLGVGQHLLAWGVASEQIQELDWWQQVNLGQLAITATPSQHFSGRGLTDGNQTLWASWVLQSPDKNIYYSGDTGYFEGFKEIGQRFGPFDLTILENGAYDQDWAEVHMTPEQTMQAHLDLQNKDLQSGALMPVHNSTFDLAFHAWYEPLERIAQLAKQQQVPIVTPIVGQQVKLDQPMHFYAWWQNLDKHNLNRQALIAANESRD